MPQIVQSTMIQGNLKSEIANPKSSAAVSIAFPPPNGKLPYTTSTYVIGAVSNGADIAACTLTLNGAPVPVWHTGAFLVMANVRPGANRITATYGDAVCCREFTVAKSASAPDKVAAAPAASNAGGKCAPASAVVPQPPDPPRDVYKDLDIPPQTPPRLPKHGAAPHDILVLVDPGHGGTDAGAISPHGWLEKDVNLAVAKAICVALMKRGFRVMITRKGDTFPKLYDRPKMAYQSGANVLISVHHNATGVSRNPRDVRHTVVYASNDLGLPLAKAIANRAFSAVTGVTNQGAQVKSLAVCRNPVVPSCLLEVDFINLPEGEEDSWNTARQMKYAEAVSQGVLDWLGQF